MIRVLGLLQRLQRRGVLVLPLEPCREPVQRLRLGGPGAFDAEGVAVVVADRVRDPLSVALVSGKPVLHGAE